MKDFRVVTREQFFKERDDWRVAVAANASEEDIVVDPGDEIICDWCNNDIEGDVSIYRENALCDDCVKSRMKP